MYRYLIPLYPSKAFSLPEIVAISLGKTVQRDGHTIRNPGKEANLCVEEPKRTAQRGQHLNWGEIHLSANKGKTTHSKQRNLHVDCPEVGRAKHFRVNGTQGACEKREVEKRWRVYCKWFATDFLSRILSTEDKIRFVFEKIIFEGRSTD